MDIRTVSNRLSFDLKIQFTKVRKMRPTTATSMPMHTRAVS